MLRTCCPDLVCLNVHGQRIVINNKKKMFNMKINMERMKLTITKKLRNIQDYCLSSFQFHCGIVHRSQVCPLHWRWIWLFYFIFRIIQIIIVRTNINVCNFLFNLFVLFCFVLLSNFYSVHMQFFFFFFIYYIPNICICI